MTGSEHTAKVVENMVNGVQAAAKRSPGEAAELINTLAYALGGVIPGFVSTRHIGEVTQHLTTVMVKGVQAGIEIAGVPAKIWVDSELVRHEKRQTIH